MEVGGVDPETTEDSSIDVTTDSTSDLSDLSSAQNQGLALLQKLQQLKVWQAAQEDLLLDEQAKQREQMLEESLSSHTEAEESLASSSDHQAIDLEERPVRGGGRTFQQLLAEKLPEEEGREGEGIEVTPARARPFLKKGSGLLKYKMSQETPVKRTPSPRKTPSSDGRKLSSALLDVGSTGRRGRKSVSIQSPPKSLKLVPPYNLSDSVENSFCDKLSLMASKQEKDRAELEVFRQLESAANEASFCSESSRIQSLVSGAVLPSPARQSKLSFVSSTPAPPQSFSISQDSPVASTAAPDPGLKSENISVVKIFQNLKYFSARPDRGGQPGSVRHARHQEVPHGETF